MLRTAITITFVGFLLLCASSPPAAAQEQGQLQILVIGGEGSINNVKQRTAREPVVEVRDQNNRPVAGALVLFEAPQQGASGTFLGGSRALQVTTDAQGRAIGQGFQPNSIQGNLELRVTATHQGMTAHVTIHMRNAGGGGASNAAQAAGHGKLIAILAGVGVAAAVGIVAATHSSGSSASSTPAAPPPMTISAGTGTVGPHP